MKVSPDVDTGLTSCFAIGYRFTDDVHDNWTKRFNKFKRKEGAAIYATVTLMKTTVPLLVKHLEIDQSKTAFMPALSSSETVASEKGILSVMARVCARSANTNFVGNAITKKVHHPLHLSGNANERRKILDEADYKSGRIKAENILIFDDFITRGDTLSHIAQAIHKTNSGIRVYGVGLGKNERRSYLRQYGREISNDRIPEKWDDIWEQGEELYRSRQRKD